MQLQQRNRRRAWPSRHRVRSLRQSSQLVQLGDQRLVAAAWHRAGADGIERRPGPVRRGRISETSSRNSLWAVRLQISETVSRKLPQGGKRQRSAACSPGCPG
ncbi:DNA-binding transcriptional MocR family regulator [Kerstersia gyiorum]|nr:DNA-binding transcriptional MocR family regulator [Kerstersia gyiorum]MCP1710418.1 DNA-binding transcriptional MocR family regulator [Kerstersia gyiorum]